MSPDPELSPEEIRALADRLEFGIPGTAIPVTIHARSPEARRIADLLRKLVDGGILVNKGERVKLTVEAAERFPGLGTRLGTVAYVANGWAGIDWDGKPERTLLPIRCLERAEP